MENKYTPVEWLFTQLYENFEMKGDGEKMNEILTKAIAMDKENFEDAYDTGFAYGFDYGKYDDEPKYSGAEQYYNKKYNN